LLSAASIARGCDVFTQFMPMAMLGKVMDVRVRRTMMFTFILSENAKTMKTFSDTNVQKSSSLAAMNLRNINLFLIAQFESNSVQSSLKTIYHIDVLNCF
jgi:hypothetical protein